MNKAQFTCNRCAQNCNGSTAFDLVTLNSPCKKVFAVCTADSLIAPQFCPGLTTVVQDSTVNLAVCSVQQSCLAGLLRDFNENIDYPREAKTTCARKCVIFSNLYSSGRRLLPAPVARFCLRRLQRQVRLVLLRPELVLFGHFQLDPLPTSTRSLGVSEFGSSFRRVQIDLRRQA